MSATRPAAIWQVPLLILAGLTAIAGLVIGIAGHWMPPPAGLAISWALAGASIAFTVARIVHAGAVTRRELELIALACGIFIAPSFVLIGVGVLTLGLALIIVDETKRVFARAVGAVVGGSSGASEHAPPIHEADPEDVEVP